MNQTRMPASRPIIALLIALGVVGRLIPHPPNFTPLGGMAIWSGIRLPRWSGVAVAIGTLFISDIFLGGHTTMPYVYGSVVAIALLASVMKPNVWGVMSMMLLGPTLFFLITNFGAWASTPMYPQTWEGLMAAYIAGIPFFKATLAGDIVYTCAFFGLEAAAHAVAKKTNLATDKA